ncbi:MAG TPA: hypothetical protein VNH16_24705 [Burkholderiales bacterium]|jgi:hypothetical protein|nr:hypothetical protein [Burkholderiales bacterium]
MEWLFARHLRSFVLLAGATSLALNLALLAPAVRRPIPTTSS